MSRLFGFSSLARGSFDLLVPPVCMVCSASLEGEAELCPACAGDMLPVVPPLCLFCGHGARRPAEGRCKWCPPGRRHFEELRGAFHYQGRLAEAHRAFKFAGRCALGPRLGHEMFLALERQRECEPWPGDCIVPVPLHGWRRWRRGYNQAALLAEELAILTRLPLEEGLLRRRRATRMQTRLPVERRAENVRDAFEAPRPERLRGRAVLLIDDVATTGSTVNECARALVEAGAARVHVRVLARA